MPDTIYIIDFGSQYTQLIARRVRELNVYCEIYPYHNIPSLTAEVKGVILSGSPSSVHEEEAPMVSVEKLFGTVPVLGICYGAQLIAQQKGGTVQQSNSREYGRARFTPQPISNGLLQGVKEGVQVWMSHGDTIQALPDDFDIIASTESIKVGAFRWERGTDEPPVFGLQFHPEVTHTHDNNKILENFVFRVCECRPDWTPRVFVERQVRKIQKKVKDGRVVMGLSGGVDSTVAACIIHQAIGEQLYGIFVNTGLLRKGEYEQVLQTYQQMGLNVKGIDASQRFLQALEGVVDPEKKRKIIGELFIQVFEEEARKIQEVQWLGQGTIYPDVIESAVQEEHAATIKSHHNVGGLPEVMNLDVIEPLNSLFKDEVRQVGQQLEVPSSIIKRHPFPGPGLAIRIIEAVTPDKVNMLQEADHIYIRALKEHGLYDDVWQAGAILLPIQTVGVMGDERTYEHVICLRAVESVDGMTADWSPLPHSFLGEVANMIINHVKGVNRVVYDISSKPPATIEWE